jgi:serine/alanine adding enzyme
MAMRPATEAETARWDELITANPDGGNVLQSLAWGDFKARWGWQPRRYVYETPGGNVAAQWLVRNVRGQGNVWYCPKGPGVARAADFAEIVEATRTANLSGIFARFESEVLDDDADKGALSRLGLTRANRDPGSKSTIFIDAHYGLRPKKYFLDYWKSQAEAGQAQLFIARHEGEVLAGIFVTYLGKRSWYKDGGSFDIKRDLNGSYLIQWEVMRWLMSNGITSYDMMGTPNRADVGTGDSRDGLYSFKSKFNPEITEFMGCWDLPLSNLRYKAWRKVGERLAARIAMRSPERFLY